MGCVGATECDARLNTHLGPGRLLMAMKILLIYGTTEGQTRKVAAFVADHLADRGHQARVVSVGDPTAADIDPCAFDAVIIAASIHRGCYQPAVLRFLEQHPAALRARPGAFLSVSLAAAGHDPDDVQGREACVARLTRQTGWTPLRVHHVAGAFRYSSYSLLKRWTMKYIAYRKGAPTDTSRNHELTDWADLARFVDAFLQEIERGRQAIG